MEKTVKHFCTTANRVKEDVVEFVKNIDWKKVAVGVGVTMAFTGVVLLSGGSAAPPPQKWQNPRADALPGRP